MTAPDYAEIAQGAADLHEFADARRAGLTSRPRIGDRILWGGVHCDVIRVDGALIDLSSRTKNGWVRWDDPTLSSAERFPVVGRL